MKIYLKHALRVGMVINVAARATKTGARVFSKYNLNKIFSIPLPWDWYPATLGLVSRTLGIRGKMTYPEPLGLVSRTLGIRGIPNPRDKRYPEPLG